MLFQSQIYAKASGSVGGATYSRNRFGSYVRAKSMPVDPSSVHQNAVRNAMRTLSNRWVEVLTDANRNAWESYAANVPWKNKLGETVYLTGLNHFLRSNSLRIQAGLAVVDSGPIQQTLADLSPVEFTLDTTDQKASIVFENDDTWSSETGGALLVFLSPPVNPSINFFKGPFRFAKAILGDTTTAPTSPTVIDLPFHTEAGQKVFGRFVSLRADGRASTPFRVADVPGV